MRTPRRAAWGTVWFLLSGMTLLLAGCSGTLQTISVVPAAGTETLTAVGQTAQFRATATYQMGSGTPTTKDVTGEVDWISASTQVATINSSGLATAVGPGNTVITAELDGETATSDVTVTLASTGSPTLTIVPTPAQATATRVGETTQFLAFGNLTGAGPMQDLTDQVQWVSSDVSLATINQAGLATAVAVLGSNGTTTITAIANNGALTATSTLQVAPATGSQQLTTLAAYEVGQGSGTIVSSPVGVDCDPAASSTHPTCTGNFPVSTVVTLTFTPDQGSTFGGSSLPATACQTVPQSNPTATACTLTMTGNETVGAIFNLQSTP